MNTTKNISVINNNILNIQNYTLDNQEGTPINLAKNKKLGIKDPSKGNNIYMNDIKVQKNEKLNKDIILSKDNSNNIFEHNIKYYDKDDINSDKKEIDINLRSKINRSFRIPHSIRRLYKNKLL